MRESSSLSRRQLLKLLAGGAVLTSCAPLPKVLPALIEPAPEQGPWQLTAMYHVEFRGWVLQCSRQIGMQLWTSSCILYDHELGASLEDWQQTKHGQAVVQELKHGVMEAHDRWKDDATLPGGRIVTPMFPPSQWVSGLGL